MLTTYSQQKNSLQDIQNRCSEELSISEFYNNLHRHGMDYDSSYQGIQQLWGRDREALARVRIPEALVKDAHAYQIHPTFLDACFQVLKAVLPATLGASDGALLYLPGGLRSFQVYYQPGRQVWSHAILTSDIEKSDGTYEGDVRLLDEHGQVMAEALGLQLVKVNAIGRQIHQHKFDDRSIEHASLKSNGSSVHSGPHARDVEARRSNEASDSPRNPVEELLVKLWSQVLGIGEIGIHDNFFELGGASLQGVQLMAKANEAGIQFTTEMLFEQQTIAKLAAVATTLQPIQNSPIFQDNIPVPEAEIIPRPQPIETGTINTIIESIGVYLPPKAVSTREILQQCHTPIHFPLEHLTGISSRRVAGETEFSIDLARKAISNCFAHSKYQPEDIDLLICANISRCDGPNFRISFEPGTSVQLKRYFGFANTLLFDISNACTGIFTAIYIIDAFIRAGLIRRGMVVSGEYITHLTQTAQKEIEGYMDSRLACLTVGDAGAALILEQSPSNKFGFHEIELYTLGRYSDYCIAKATDKEHGGAIMFTDSIKIASLNTQQAISHAAHVLKRSGRSPEMFQHIIMHQTSRMTLNDAAREINRFYGREICNQDTVIDNLSERGNTATTTHILALMDSILSNRIDSGENVIFGITGSGATIGTALYAFDDLPERLRRSAVSQQRSDTATVKAGQSKTVHLSPPIQSIPRLRIESIGTPPTGVQVKREALELARIAAEHCLEKSSYTRRDIDLLIYAGVYRDDFICEPAMASLVTGSLKMNDTIESQQDKKTFAFDIFNGAIGFLNACYVARGMIKAKRARNVMVVASEIENNKELSLAELRGLRETGSAVILDESPDGLTGFGNFLFKYYTDYIESFRSYTGLRRGKPSMYFEEDPGIEASYLHCIVDAVHELLRMEQLDMAQIKMILPPQISSTFIAELSSRMNLSRGKFVNIAHESGDLFTSGLAYTLQYVREQNLVKPGEVGLIISVGTGIQVGCATYYF